jgi:hypothetical protein
MYSLLSALNIHLVLLPPSPHLSSSYLKPQCVIGRVLVHALRFDRYCGENRGRVIAGQELVLYTQ